MPLGMVVENIATDILVKLGYKESFIKLLVNIFSVIIVKK